MTEIEHKKFPKGDFIFRDGESGELAFVIKEGAVNIVKEINGKETILGSIGKGAMFGEMALIDNKPRMASARSADNNTVLIVISREVFKKRLEKSDPFIQGVLHILAEKVRSLSANKKGQP